MSDDMPDLEDFSEELSKKKQNTVDLGDYTKPKDQKPPSIPDGFQGLKKGFLNNSNDDVIKPKQKKNPLEIDEVQQNMKQEKKTEFGQFLAQNKEEWLNQELLNKIMQNPKLQKLFSNPEYLQAVQQMQTNPTGVMQRYKNNLEFVELMTEYMKTIGQHFETLKPKQTQQQQQQAPKVVPIKEPKTQEEKIQHIIETDNEVIQVLKDPRVVAFIEYLQKTGKVDFQEIAYKDPQLMQKLQVLISKGVLNVQRM